MVMGVIMTMDMAVAAAMATSKTMEMVTILADTVLTATTKTSYMVKSPIGLVLLPTIMTPSLETSAATSTNTLKITGMATIPIDLDKVKEAATSITSHTDLVVTMITVVREAVILMTTDLRDRSHILVSTLDVTCSVQRPHVLAFAGTFSFFRFHFRNGALLPQLSEWLSLCREKLGTNQT